MREDQPEAEGCERATAGRRRHSAAPAEFFSEGAASDARQTDRGGDGMNGNEARTEGPNERELMSPSERHSADPSVRVKSADGRRSAREGLQASGRPHRRYPASDAAARQLAGMACATAVRRGLATGLDGERGRSGRTASNGPYAIRERTHGHPGMTPRRRTKQGRATGDAWEWRALRVPVSRGMACSGPAATPIPARGQ